MYDFDVYLYSALLILLLISILWPLRVRENLSTDSSASQDLDQVKMNQNLMAQYGVLKDQQDKTSQALTNLQTDLNNSKQIIAQNQSAIATLNGYVQQVQNMIDQLAKDAKKK